jgi:hypothetical protein
MDPMLAAKLGFLQSVALQLEPFLTQFQSNSPLLPFMYADLCTLLHNLLARFIKADIMTGATTAVKLLAIDFKKKENHMVLHNIDIGFAASSICKKVTGVENLQFKEQCCLFLQHLCGKLTEKCRLNYRLVKGVTCLNPQVMLEKSLRQSRVSTARSVCREEVDDAKCSRHCEARLRGSM